MRTLNEILSSPCTPTEYLEKKRTTFKTAFSEKAKAKNVLIVSGESFGCKEFVRISYCVSTKTVKGALPIFKELIEC